MNPVDPDEDRRKRYHDLYHREPVYGCQWCTAAIKGRTHNERGQVIYARRSNVGMERERLLARGVL